MIKSIKINKGVIAFYIIIALLTMLCVFRMNNLAVIGSSNTSNTQESCYA